MSRFFHALVVFGASASLSGCSASATTPPDGGVGGTQGSAEHPRSVLVTAPEKPEASGNGGVPPDAGPVPDATTLAQWNCGSPAIECSGDFLRAVRLRGACPVDESRPRAPSDCKPGEWFECDAAIFRGKDVAVDCRCTASADSGAGCAPCSEGGKYQPIISCTDHEKLCGCVTTGILVH